jgi:hypothetical protein
MSARRQYWRVTFLTAEGKRRTVWARELVCSEKAFKFWIVDRSGEDPEPRERVVAATVDVLRVQAARMNNFYPLLELAKVAT